MIARPRVWKQRRWKFHPARNGEKEIHQQQRQQRATDFQDPPRSPPADLFRIIKYRFTFFHAAWSPRPRGRVPVTGFTPSGEPQPLYCKMPSNYEANFLESCRGTFSRDLRTAVFPAEVSR